MIHKSYNYCHSSIIGLIVKVGSRKSSRRIKMLASIIIQALLVHALLHVS